MLRGGYGGTAVNDILADAGIAKGSFYHHFESKEAFAIALARRFFERHEQILGELIADEETPADDRLRSYFGGLLERATNADARERGCLLALFALEVSRSSEPIAEAVSAEFELWEELLAELVEQGQQRGEIRDEATPRAIAGTLISGWEGALMRARLANDVEPLRSFLAVVLDGLVMRPSEANR